MVRAQRTGGQSGRMRRIMLVAMARKLTVALWRYLEVGLVPDDVSHETGSLSHAANDRSALRAFRLQCPRLPRV